VWDHQGRLGSPLKTDEKLHGGEVTDNEPLTVKTSPELAEELRFVTLRTGLLNLTAVQLSQLGISQTDRNSMLNPLLDAIKPWLGKEYTSIPEHIKVTARMSVWSQILALLAFWQPANLLQEEELENLKAIIGGTMKAARSST
jgi:hypothetical protein